jgi:hypothetical protein
MIAKLISALRRGARVTAAVSSRASSTRRPTARLSCKGRRAYRLDADDADIGAQRPCRDRNARNQTAATDRDDQGIEIRRLLEDLERDCSLAGDDSGLGERVDVEEAFGFGMAQGRQVAVIPRFARHFDARPPAREFRELVGSHRMRQEDRRGHSRGPAGIGHREPVIAARRGDDAAPESCSGRSENRIDCAARLE